MGAGHAIALGIWDRVLFYAWRSENPALFSMPFSFLSPALNRSDCDMRYQIPQEYDNPACEIVHDPSLAFWPEELKTLLTFSRAGRIVLLGEGCSVKGQTVLILVWIGAVFFFLKAYSCRSHIPVIDLQGRGAFVAFHVENDKPMALKSKIRADYPFSGVPKILSYVSVSIQTVCSSIKSKACFSSMS